MSIFQDIEAGLIGRGFNATQARGIAAGIYAEGGVNGSGGFNINPTSGAYGVGQWLGGRKRALFAKYGPNPTLSNQLDFLAYELRGGDAGGAAVLRQTTQQSVAGAYITRFMRPAAGAETTGDLSRASVYLANGGNVTAANGQVGSGRSYLNSVLGDGWGNYLSDGMVGLGGVLAAPGDALFGGLSLSDWFTRITIGLFALLLIAVALYMLSGNKVQDIAGKLPPVVPV